MNNESTTIQSPRLQQLYTAMQRPGGSALPDFWQELQRQGAPLIEPDTEGFALVTFVWRDDGVARNIAVLQDFGADGIREHHMQRLPNSDLWYYTRRLRSDTRTTYQFSPSPADDPSVAGGFQLDPFNAKTYPGFLFEDGNAILFSLLELPDAPPLPWRGYQPSKKGRIELYTPFADQRRFWLYTPDGAITAPLPVLLVFDGRIYKDLTRLPQILDYLIDRGQIPPLLALMMDNQDRSELQCNPDFAAYIAETVLPWLRTTHAVSNEPQQTAVLGSSLGGLAALYLAYRYPTHVGTVFTQTGWFRWMPADDPEHHWLARQLAASPQLPLRLHLQVGNLEIAQMADGGPSQLAANELLRDRLVAKGYPITYQEYSGGHDASSLEAPLAQGLLALFGNDTKGERTSYRLQGFLGSWQLIPERSVYSTGGPPKQATYAISGDQHELTFTIDWVDQSDKPFHVVYTCIPDGVRHTTAISPTVDEMQTAITGNNLQTLSYKDGNITAIADRKLSANGQELEVLQRYLRPDGSELRILQFYIRG